MRLKIPLKEFYAMNPRLFTKYLPYYKEKLKQDTENDRQMLDLAGWVNGVYVSHAVAQLGKHKFPEKPLDIFGVGNKYEEEEEQEEAKVSDGFRAFAFVYNLERQRKEKLKESEVKDIGC